jgi:hypothetical protein
MARAMLAALQEEELHRREGVRIGLGFVLMTSGVFCALAFGLLNAWEPMYMLIVAIILGITLLVTGQALGILIAELVTSRRRMDVAVTALAKLAEKAIEGRQPSPADTPQKPNIEAAAKAFENL